MRAKRCRTSFERLFKDFFIEEGAHIGKYEVLMEAARDAGMDESVVAALLATDQHREAVSQEIAVAQQMGVTGVPCFIINNKYAVMGAQPADQIVGAIKQAAQMKEVASSGVESIKAFPLIHEVYPAAWKKFRHSSGVKRSQISPMASMS